MTKILSYLIYKTLFFFDFIFKIISKRSILIYFKEFMEKDSYKKILK